jgi:lipoprotein-releasing system permease protein
MKPGPSFYIACRYLFSRTGRSLPRIWSAAALIGVSLVPLVVVFLVTDGMIEGITTRFMETGTYHLQAVPLTEDASDAAANRIRKIQAVPGVRHVFEERQGLGLVYSETGRSGVQVRAVDPGYFGGDTGFTQHMEILSGEFSVSDDSSMVLGRDTADRLGVEVGDQVRLLTVRPSPGGGVLPRVSSFVVTGVVSTGYQDLDRIWVFISLSRGRSVLADGASRSFLGIKVDNPFSLENALYRGPVELSDLFAGRLYPGREIPYRIGEILGYHWRVRTWYELERSRYLSFQTTKNLLVFIMFLIVCVASVNISSSLVLLVIEKQSEIAIMKSYGVGPGEVGLIFLSAGFIVGSVGTALGVVFGVLAAVNINGILVLLENGINMVLSLGRVLLLPFMDIETINVDLFSAEFYLESIPLRLNPVQLLVVAILSILLATVASYIPAARAAGIRPLEVTRRH